MVWKKMIFECFVQSIEELKIEAPAEKLAKFITNKVNEDEK